MSAFPKIRVANSGDRPRFAQKGAVGAGTNRNDAHFLKAFSPHREPRLKRTPLLCATMQVATHNFGREGHPASLTHISESESGSGYAYFRKIGGPGARFRKTPLWDSRPPQTMHTTYRWRGSIYG